MTATTPADDSGTVYQYRNLLDPLLTWQDAKALEAWKTENPDDIRAHVVILEAMP